MIAETEPSYSYEYYPPLDLMRVYRGGRLLGDYDGIEWCQDGPLPQEIKAEAEVRWQAIDD